MNHGIIIRLQKQRWLRIAPLLVLFLATAFPQLAQAAAGTWAGTTTGNSWNTGSNWTGGTTPANGATLTFGLTTSGTTTLDTGTFTSIGALTFTSAASSYTFGGGTITLGGNVINLSANLQTINNAMTMTAVRTFTMTAGGGNLTLGGNLVGTGGGITTAGAGTLTLSGNNTYTAATTLGLGTTLVLDYSSQDNSKFGGSLAMSGATLQLSGGSFAQTATSFTLNTGASYITRANSNTGSISLGAITRNAGSTLAIADGTLTATSSGTINSLLTATAGAYAVVGGNDWAAKDASNLYIVGFSTVGAYNNTTATALGGTGNQTDVANGMTLTTLSADASTSTIRFNQAQATTLDLGGFTATLTQGGLLITSAVGANTSTITNGTLKSGANNALQIIQNNTSDALVIGATIVDYNTGSLTPLTKSGPGTLTLSGANTYTGYTYISEGTVVFNNATALGTISAGGTGSVTFNGPATLVINTSGTIGALTSANTGYGTITASSGTPVTLTVSQTGNTTFSGVLQNGSSGGTLTLIKAGSGQLTLSGANTYTGGTVITLGSVAISSDSNLGATTGTLTFNGTGNITYSDGLVLDANRTVLFSSGANVSLANRIYVNGALTGSGAFSVTTADEFKFLNANNTFSGTITSATAGSANYGLDMASIGDDVGAGLINLGSGGTSGTFRWISASGTTTTLVNRQFSLNGTTGSGLISALGTTAAANLVINRDLLITGVGAKALILAGTNTGDNTFAGIIPDGGGSVISLTKSEAGKWILSGANTYTGITTISGGILSVGTLANGGAASNLGSSSSAAANLVFSGGTLQFTGANGTTDRLFTINNANVTLDASGSGSLNFTNTGNLANSASFTAVRTITLTGTSTANNTLTPAIVSATGSITALTKSGSGLWILSGNNTYAGTTTISGGTLSVGTINTAGAGNLGSLSATTGTLSLSGGVLQYTGAGATLSSPWNLVAATSSGIDVANTLTITTAAPNTTGALTKYGNGTLILTGNNLYTGATTINSGTLLLSGSGSIGSSATITVGSAGVFDVSGVTYTLGSARTLGGTGTVAGNATFGAGSTFRPGNAANTVGLLTFANSATVSAGSTYSWTVNSVSGSLTQSGAGTNFDQLNVAETLTMNNTGSININLDGVVVTGWNPHNSYAWTIATAGTLTSLGTGTYNLGTSSFAGINSIGNGSFTFATNTGSSGSLVLTFNGSSVPANYYWSVAGAGTGTWDDQNTAAWSYNTTGTGGSFTWNNAIPESAYFSASNSGTGAFVVTVGSVTAGAIYVNSGTPTFSGGTIAFASGGGTISISTSAGATISSVIADGAVASSITKVGTGTWYLTGDNSYSGGTTFGAGMLVIGSANNLGSSAGTLTFSGGSLQVSTGGLTLSNPINITGAGTATFDVNNMGTLTLSGPTLTFGAGTTRLQALNNGTLTIDSNTVVNIAGAQAVFQGSGNIVVGGTITGAGSVTASSSLTGTLTLTGVNTYTGNTTISGGQLIISGAGQLNSGSYGGTISIAAGSTFTYNSSAPQTLSGTISGAGALIKGGSSTLTLSGTQTFSGGATITSGTMKMQSGAFGTAARYYTIASGAVLNLDGGATPSNASTITGTGTLSITNGQLSGAGTQKVIMQLSQGAWIDVQSTGALINDDYIWSSNQASLNLDGTLDLVNAGGGGKPVEVDALTGTGTVTTNNGFGARTMIVGVAGGSGVFDGIIRNGSQNTILTKEGSGTQTLTGLNTYSGATTINGGILSVGTLTNSGTNSNIGTGGLTINGGALRFTGTGVNGTSNRLFTLGVNGGTLDASGSGSLNFTNAGSLTIQAGGGARTLTLTGTSTVNNTFRPVIADAGAGSLTSVTKSGVGTWILSGANTYTGNTTITAGTLALGVAGGLPNSAVITVASGANFDVSALTSGFTITSGQALSGQGVVQGAVNAGDGSIINPGIGTLTITNTINFSGTPILQFGLTGNPSASGQIIVSNALNITGMSTNWFVLSDAGGFTMTDYTLFRAVGGLTGTLQADGTNWFNIFNSGWDAYLFDNGSGDVVLRVVPEPSAFVLVGAGIAGLLLMRRFRRK